MRFTKINLSQTEKSGKVKVVPTTHKTKTQMTNNEQFRINSLWKLASEAAEKAADARWEAERHTALRCTFNGDAETYLALREKELKLCALFGEAERMAFDATRRAYYAELAAK